MRLTVAPLRFGAGAKGKVINSLAAGVPCVATAIATEGLGLDDKEIVVADDPREFARAVVRAYTDAALWQPLVEHGLLWARRSHSMDAATKGMQAMLDFIGAPSPSSVGGAQALAS